MVGVKGVVGSRVGSGGVKGVVESRSRVVGVVG